MPTARSRAWLAPALFRREPRIKQRFPRAAPGASPPYRLAQSPLRWRHDNITDQPSRDRQLNTSTADHRRCSASAPPRRSDTGRDTCEQRVLFRLAHCFQSFADDLERPHGIVDWGTDLLRQPAVGVGQEVYAFVEHRSLPVLGPDGGQGSHLIGCRLGPRSNRRSERNPRGRVVSCQWRRLGRQVPASEPGLQAVGPGDGVMRTVDSSTRAVSVRDDRSTPRPLRKCSHR